MEALISALAIQERVASTGYKRDKRGQALHFTDWQPWVIFFLEALNKQKENLDAKIKRERLILGDLPELSVQILEIAREHGRVTINDIETITGVSRGTIKDHVKSLHKNGHIERHGAGRGTWYSLA